MEHINYLTECVTAQMVATCPPSQEWWDDHYSLLNGEMFLTEPRVEWVSQETHYVEHWDLIQQTFHFIVGYKASNDPTDGEDIYLRDFKSLLIKIKRICEEKPGEDYDHLVEDIGKDFEWLAIWLIDISERQGYFNGFGASQEEQSELNANSD